MESAFHASQVIRQAIPDSSNGDIAANPNATELCKKLGAHINDHPLEKSYNVCLSSVPVTIERLPYIPSPHARLQDPGTARADIAATTSSPNGTTENDYAAKHAHQTVMQQHCAYFDADHDGQISMKDTWHSIRAWGWNPFLSLLAVLIINLNLSYPTQRGWLPDPRFRINIANVHKCKHGSDSMSYDNEGRFRPQSFEDMMAKYDRGNKGGLDVSDLVRAHKGQRMCGDFFGWSASFLECESAVFSSCPPHLIRQPLARVPGSCVDSRLTEAQGWLRISSSGPRMEFCARRTCDVFSTEAYSSGKPKSMPQSSNGGIKLPRP